MTTSSIAPARRPLLGYSRATGEPVVLVPSCSEPSVCHIVTMDGCCSCKGYSFRKSCRHVAPAANDLRDGSADLRNGSPAHLAVKRAAGEWPTVSPEVAAKAAEYRAIFGSDE
jgi:hypothetical protein